MRRSNDRRRITGISYKIAVNETQCIYMNKITTDNLNKTNHFESRIFDLVYMNTISIFT